MTRNEYAKLLQTEYWKGYSYALIKERNFTCGDCGRQFHNQRNKLQVHHLVYRNTYPWSYNSDEVIVLCDECHKKRHGIWHESNDINTRSDETNRRYNDGDEDINSFYSKPSWFRRNKEILLLLLIIITLGLILLPTKRADRHNLPNNESVVSAQSEDHSHKSKMDVKKVKGKKTKAKTAQEDIALTKEDISDIGSTTILRDISDNDIRDLTSAKPTQDLSGLEKKIHANAVESAKRAGVSTEGSTSDILSRINHAHAVESAKRAGVSTEGSTSDILMRITQKQMENIR